MLELRLQHAQILAVEPESSCVPAGDAIEEKLDEWRREIAEAATTLAGQTRNGGRTND